MNNLSRVNIHENTYWGFVTTKHFWMLCMVGLIDNSIEYKLNFGNLFDNFINILSKSKVFLLEI